MAKTIVLSDDDLYQALHEYLLEVDADELARLAGELFGGECYFFGGDYNFYPDENYAGAFGKAEE